MAHHGLCSADAGEETSRQTEAKKPIAEVLYGAGQPGGNDAACEP